MSRRVARAKLASFLTVVLFGVVVARLGQIQILNHARYHSRAEQQHTHRVQEEARRGKILDRNGALLAGNRAVVTFEVYWPSVEEGGRSAVDSLVGRLGPWACASRPLQPRGVNQILARDVPYDSAAVYIEEGLPTGVNWTVGSRRTYPLGDVTASVIGRYSADHSEGLESSRSSLLAGRDGLRYVRYSGGSDVCLTVPDAENRPPRDGMDLMLTLDSRLQSLSMEYLREAVDSSGSSWGAVVMVDPRCGDVLAMASYPVRCDNGALAMNHCLQGYHEPGSTFKLVTMAACLEEGVVDPRDEFDCSRGQIAVADRTISDCHKFGRLTVEEIFAHSSNVGTIKLARLLEDEVFYGYCTDMGFGSRTGVELPGESSGLLSPPAEWSGVSKASIAIGQEVTVTPLQMAMAYAAVANGGILYQPRVVKACRGQEGWQELATFARRRVFSPETAARIRRMMHLAVEEGTASTAGVHGVEVAGKTGTAERLSQGEGEYLSAFVGMVPADSPRLVTVIVMDSPDYEYRFGSALAAPLFAEVVDQAIGVEPALALSPLQSDGTHLAAEVGR
jgi:cell division protein FtsI/penicillin-binding protein 2